MASTSDYCRMQDFECVYCGRLLHSRVIVINALYPELATNCGRRRECVAKDASDFQLPAIWRPVSIPWCLPPPYINATLMMP